MEPLLPEEETALSEATPAPAEAPAPARSRTATAIRVAAEIIKSIALLVVGAVVALVIVPNSWISRLDGMSEADKLALVKALVRENYLHPDDADYEGSSDLLAAAYVYGLGDPYSYYFSAEEFSDVLRDNLGNAVGIGVSVARSSDPVAIYLYHVYEGSPAQEAGLQEGDRILAVDGEAVTADNYSQRVAAVRGEPGSTVALTVLRGEETFDVDVMRNEHTMTTVYTRVVDGVGVVEITDFNQATLGQFENAIATLLDQGVSGLVFDLRDNTGGLVDTASEMLDILLPEGELGYAIYNGGRRQSMATSDASAVDLPMAVLTSRSTASSAEYFSSALRDFDKAILVGETTYGKSVMQTTFPLGDGSAVRLTVAQFFTKSGTDFNGKGLVPDVEVSLPEGVDRHFVTDAEDTVLRAALAALKK